MRTLREHQGVQDLFAPLEAHEEEHPVTDAFDFLLSITGRVAPLRDSRLPNALLSRGYDLDRISAASLFSHPSLRLPLLFAFRRVFLSYSFVPGVVSQQRQKGLKIGAEQS